MNPRHLPDSFPHGVHASPFRPAWWLRNPHAQTVFSPLFRKPPAVQRQREKISLSDGDWIYLDWLLPSGWEASLLPLVVVVHGLSGSSDSLYVRGVQRVLESMGWGSVAMNCRGATGGANGLPRAYHAGGSDDIREVVAAVVARHGGHPLAVVGYSLGGNMTLKFMAEQGDDPRLFAATAVSVPLRLDLCADRMDSGFSRLYRKRLLDELMLLWHAKREYFRQQGDTEAVSLLDGRLAQGPFRSFWQFDDQLMAPLHGFAGVDDYYQRCSSRQFLRDIRVPTLVIHAEDDPFMTPGVIPASTELSPCVHFELSRRGGHVGFVESAGRGGAAYYLDRRVPQFLQSCFVRP